jgi:hypothetical protein
MSFEIHMYSAVAQAAERSGFPAGELHPLLIFLKQAPGTAHDTPAAAFAASKAGWTRVDVTKAGTLPEDAGATMQDPVRAAYVSAVEGGVGVMAFDAVVKAAARK